MNIWCIMDTQQHTLVSLHRTREDAQAYARGMEDCGWIIVERYMK